MALTIFYEWGLPPLADGLLGLPLAVRRSRSCSRHSACASARSCRWALVPSPRSTDHKSEYVAWGWAVNGFASVVGAVLSTILAMSFGFRTVLLVAMVVYLIALLALRGLLAPRGHPSTHDGCRAATEVQ